MSFEPTQPEPNQSEPTQPDTPKYSAQRGIRMSLKRDFSRRDTVLLPEPADQTVGESYRSQLLRFKIDGVEFLLTTADAQLSEWPAPLPLESERHREVLDAITGYWLSSWHPAGMPTPIAALAERDAAFETVLTRLRADVPSLEVIAATAVHPLGSWVEGGLIVRGIDKPTALTLATLLGQSALIAITGQGIEVISVDNAFEGSRHRVQLIELPSTPCPMLVGFESELPCKSQGGPSGGRGAAAAAYWQEQRVVAVSRLGCGVCLGNSSINQPQSKDAFVSHKWAWRTANASRHGTATEVVQIEPAPIPAPAPAQDE